MLTFKMQPSPASDVSHEETLIIHEREGQGSTNPFAWTPMTSAFGPWVSREISPYALLQTLKNSKCPFSGDFHEGKEGECQPLEKHSLPLHSPQKPSGCSRYLTEPSS